jgi:hypothetical protein
MARRQFRRMEVPLGRRHNIPVLVASEDGLPQMVTMSYGAFLQLTAKVDKAARKLRKMKGDEVRPSADLLDMCISSPEDATADAFEVEPAAPEIRQAEDAQVIDFSSLRRDRRALA